MRQLRLPTSTINKIVDDPTLVGKILSGNNSTDVRSLGISIEAAVHILQGYNDGFRDEFIMNASLAAVAMVASVLMIRHKELTRPDEVQLKARAEKEERERPGKQDVEMGKIDATADGADHDRKA